MPIVGQVDEFSRKLVSGWTADDERPDRSLEVAIFVNGTEVGRTRSSDLRIGVKAIVKGSDGKCGFEFRFDPPLSVLEEYTLEVRVAGMDHVLLPGARQLRRPATAMTPLLPILVTSSGRAGSTLLMQYLLDLPEVVAGLAYPYELKLGNYYSAAFSVLAADEDRVNSTDPDTMFDSKYRHMIGSNPFTRTGNHVGTMQTIARQFFDERIPAVFAETFRNLILEYYTLLRQQQNKPNARYFAEKSSLDEAARKGPRAFFGSVREIVMVRDPRDLLCSSKAFWKLSSRRALRLVVQAANRLEEISKKPDQDMILVKYEDLVSQPSKLLEKIGDFIGVSRESWAGSIRDDKIFRMHSTSTSPQSSIGRWRTELSLEEVEACEQRMRNYLEIFGYDVGIVR